MSGAETAPTLCEGEPVVLGELAAPTLGEELESETGMLTLCDGLLDCGETVPGVASDACVTVSVSSDKLLGSVGLVESGSVVA
jgi:hypothetical protein